MINQEKFLLAKEPFAMETVFWHERYLLNERDVMPGPFAHVDTRPFGSDGVDDAPVNSRFA